MHALRAFEAAARHLNFSRAADELHITHGAVSHALRAMEDEIGTALFRRRGNAMLLTDVGQRLAVQVRDALSQLARGMDEAHFAARGAAERPALTVSVLPAFAARWLIPRLPGFYAAHSSVDVVLRATAALDDLLREEVDLAIRYGPGHWPGLEAEKLLTEALFPVCSPALLERCRLQVPADLFRDNVVLLRDLRQPWTDWFQVAGLAKAMEPMHGPAFTDAGLLIQAASAGQGVALARAQLVREELATRRLVRLFSDCAQATYAYYLVRPSGAHHTQAAAAFSGWLRQEVASEQANEGVR